MKKIVPEEIICDKTKKKNLTFVLKLRDFDYLLNKLDDVEDYDFVREYEKKTAGKKIREIPFEQVIKNVLRKSRRS